MLCDTLSEHGRLRMILRTFFSRLASILFIGLVYLFFYAPLAILVVFSFNNAPFPSPWKEFTLHWYHELFTNTHVWQALANSFVIAICATVLSISMTLCLVYYRVHYRQQRLFDRSITLFYANILIPEVVLGVGLLNLFVLCAVPLGKITLIIAHTVLGLGFAVPLIFSRFQELDQRMIEASLDLGAQVSQTFFKIIVPLLRPALVATALLVFILSFDDFVVSYFCSGTAVQTLSLYLLSMLRTGISPMMNSLSTFLLIFTSMLVGMYCWIVFGEEGDVA